MEIHPIQRIKEHLKRLAADLKPMSFPKKLDHLWTYYKWVLVVLAVIACIISIICTGISNKNKDVLIAGMLVNTSVDTEGYDYLTTGYFNRHNGVKGKQEVELTSTNFEDPSSTQEISTTYTAIMRIVTRVSAQQLDYVFTDELGLQTCMNQDLLLDLGEIFSEEELDALEEDVISLYYEEEDITVPVAINLRALKFSENHVTSEGDRYIAFIANTTKPENCRDFWEYLKQAQ